MLIWPESRRDYQPTVDISTLFEELSMVRVIRSNGKADVIDISTEYIKEIYY
jgi:hypothetical protein